MYIYIYINYELEHYEIEYMNMQYEIIWICEYEIIQRTYNYEYIYMDTCTYNIWIHAHTMYISLWINYKIIIKL